MHNRNNKSGGLIQTFSLPVALRFTMHMIQCFWPAHRPARQYSTVFPTVITAAIVSFGAHCPSVFLRLPFFVQHGAILVVAPSKNSFAIVVRNRSTDIDPAVQVYPSCPWYPKPNILVVSHKQTRLALEIPAE